MGIVELNSCAALGVITADPGLSGIFIYTLLIYLQVLTIHFDLYMDNVLSGVDRISLLVSSLFNYLVTINLVSTIILNFIIRIFYGLEGDQLTGILNRLNG